MSLQGFMDAIGEQGRQDRSKYHLTLGELIARLEAIAVSKPDMAVELDFQPWGLSNPDSYRGYYSDLAFEPTEKLLTVKKFLEVCKGALNKTFEGWKGGDFKMTADTPLWVAFTGSVACNINRLVNYDDPNQPGDIRADIAIMGIQDMGAK